MADWKPTEGRKATVLTVRCAPEGTSPEHANVEWVEVMVQMDGDIANWRLMQMRPLWIKDVSRPASWQWVYTWGSPAFVRQGEIYRIHSGSRMRAATHPEPDDLVPGRKHVYAAGPLSAARLIWAPGDWVRLVEAFGAVIDEVIITARPERPREEEPAAR